MITGKPISIRTRLTLWYSAVLALGLVLFALAVWILLRQVLYADLHRELTVRTGSLETFITNELKEPGVHLTEELTEYAHGLPEGTRFWFLDDHNTKLFSSDPSFRFPSDRDLLQSDSPWMLWKQPRYLLTHRSATLQGKTYRIVGAISAEDALAILHQLRILLITLMPVVVLIASLGGLLLSRRALQSVDQITGAAQILSINDLSGRLPVAKTGDELQRLSETWNSMLDRLQDAVERLSRFTQDASHELRTPLAIIRSTAEIASRRSRTEEAYRSAFGQIIQESDRLTTLVEDLLLLARGDAPSSPEFKCVDLAVLLSDVCQDMNVLARMGGITLTSAAIGDPVVIRGNELLVRRLLVVLIDNAIKYSREGGTIRVSLEIRDGSATIEIADSGIGIPREDLDHIFERFYRGESAREVWSNGAGLGLSLAASIVQQHGATIDVQSPPRKGSVFTVTFPVLTPRVLTSVDK